ncbi:MAG: DUF6159 family protein [Fimbriimonas sp.]
MFGDRFRRSWQVAKESYAVLKSNPSLMLFPILSGAATLALSIPLLVIMGIALMAASASQTTKTHEEVFGVLHYAVMAVTYFVNYFVVIFFNSALVACAHEALQGRPTSTKFGFEAAGRRLPQIILWAAISSTVGMILKAISERSGIVGALVSTFIGLAWNLAVFFVVPVLVIDNEKPFEAIKTSVGMIRKTWGEKLILGIGISVAIGVLCLVAFTPMFAGIAFAVSEMYVLAIVCVVVSVLLLLGIAIAGSAMTTIHQTALYIYCRTGESPSAYSPDLIAGAFAPKPERKFFGR